MKYYDGGKPIYESTAKIEKREALILLRRAETKVADGQQEGSAVNRTRFEDLIEELNRLHPQAAQTWKLVLRVAIWRALSPQREPEEPKLFVIPSTANVFSKLTNQR